MTFQSSGPIVALGSFPGSGNSWVHELLESATGIYIVMDHNYVAAGMIGEGVTTDNVIARIMLLKHLIILSGSSFYFLNHYSQNYFQVFNLLPCKFNNNYNFILLKHKTYHLHIILMCNKSFSKCAMDHE